MILYLEGPVVNYRVQWAEMMCSGIKLGHGLYGHLATVFFTGQNLSNFGSLVHRHVYLG